MKKFIAIAAIAIAFASCEEKKAETPVEAPKTDSPAVVAPAVDTTAPKMDTAAPKMDTAAPKMETKKEEGKK